MKVTINIEIGNSDELKAISSALANMHEVSTVETPVAVEAPVEQSEVVESKPVASTSQEYDREALETEAKKLGVKFRSDISDKSLSIKISDFKKDNPKPVEDNIQKDIDEAMKSENVAEEKNASDELKARIKEAKGKQEEETVEDEEEVTEEEEEEEETNDVVEEEEVEEPEVSSASDKVATLKDALKSKRNSKSAIKNKARKAKKVNWD